MAIGNYYHRLRELLVECARYNGSIRPFICDHKGWYLYHNKKKKLYNVFVSEDMERLLQRTRRSLYMTLNYFSPDEAWLNQYQDGELPGWESCEAYMLSVDIDLHGSIDDPEDYKLLQKAYNYTYRELEKITSGHLVGFCSGNGAYIFLHPSFATPKKDVVGEDRVKAYEMITRAFNARLYTIHDEILEKHPETQGKISIDLINNRNRQIKAPLSIHKKLDYVVYPVTDSVIPRKPYTEVTDEDIKKVKELWEYFIGTVVTESEQKLFNRELEKYIRHSEMQMEDSGHLQEITYHTPREPYPLEVILEDPVMAAIFSREYWGDGGIRRITIMASVLKACGWSLQDARDLIHDITSGWPQPDDLERRIRYGYEMIPPTYQTIYSEPEGFPRVSLGDLREHLPGQPIDVKHPLQRIRSLYKEHKTIKALKEDGLVFEDGDLYYKVNYTEKRIQRVRVRYAGPHEILDTRDVVDAIPVKVTAHESPLDGDTSTFDITFESLSRTLKPRVTDHTLEEVVDYLRNQGLILNNYHARDVLSHVLNGYRRKGLCEVDVGVRNPGFYMTDGRITVSRYTPEYDEESLTRALLILTDLMEEHFKEQAPKLLTHVKWSMISPFIYIKKQKGEMVPWIYDYGKSQAGKTTMGIIALRIWGLTDTEHYKGGGAIDTLARLGHVLSQGTFPVLINEPKGAFLNENVQEALKNSIEGPTSRGKYVNGRYKDIPALAPCIITSNSTLPQDEALLNRFLVMDFTHGERKDMKTQKRFNERYRPRNFGDESPLYPLKHLGGYVARRILRDPDLLHMDWMKLADKLLREAYRDAGLPVPDWAGEWAETMDIEEAEEDQYTAIITAIMEIVNEAYDRRVTRLPPGPEDSMMDSRGERHVARTLSYEEKIPAVLGAVEIPYILLREGRGGRDYVDVTTQFLDELKRRKRLDLNLKSLADLMGWEYTVVKMGERSIRVARATYDQFIHLVKVFESGETGQSSLSAYPAPE